MNMQVKSHATSAELELSDAFHRGNHDSEESHAVRESRKALFAEFSRQGLPSRRTEAWHYTDLKALLKRIPPAIEAPFEPAISLLDRSKCFSILDETEFGGETIEGVSSVLLSSDLKSGFVPGSFTSLGADDAIGQINGSFAKAGRSIWIGANIDLSAPIELLHHHAGGTHHARTHVNVGHGARATIIERHSSESAAAALVSTVSTLRLGDSAEVVWIILQQQGIHDTHLGQLRVFLGEDAKLRIFVINAGGRLVRQELRLIVGGEGGDLQVRGINLLAGDTHCDVTLSVDHQVANTTSVEINRSVLLDRAHGVFQGLVRVAPDAQKTNARMSCNTLLLSDDARFSGKPELEIFADDVQCGHGATVSDIDGNHLYYLMARGIPERVARGLLVSGFVSEMLDELTDTTVSERLTTVVEDWLAKHA